ncbi:MULTISPECIES: hypothetical protein [Bacillus cereus group]|uniref:hypothetical protein n=1 Tax=Bacillus anthracis TaxID=1392 RepID=UPI0011BA93AB|nr:hypothetical protein [Bacillus anthracis]
MVLNYDDLPDRAKKIFDYLSISQSNSKSFIEDPSYVLSNLLFGEKDASQIPRSTISLGNKLLFSLLKNKDFLAWGQELQNRLSSTSVKISQEELIKEIRKVVFKHLDPSILKEIEDTQLKEIVNIRLVDSEDENSKESEMKILSERPVVIPEASNGHNELDPIVADVAVVVTAVVAAVGIIAFVAVAIAHENPDQPSRIELENISRAISEGLITRASGGFEL